MLLRRFIVLFWFALALASGARPADRSLWDRLQIAGRRIASKPVHRPRSLRLEAGDVAIDPHVHTYHSPDSKADIRDIVVQAAQRRLAAIAITDHNTMDGVKEAREVANRLYATGRIPAPLRIIPGEEVSTTEGHVVALYLASAIPAGLSAAETIKRIHAQGGLAIAAHPMDANSLGNLALTLPFDGLETMNGAEETSQLFAKRASRERRDAFYDLVTTPRYGSSDAHEAKLVGMCYTILPDCEPTEGAIRAALYAGRILPGEAPALSSRTRGVIGTGRWLTWMTASVPSTSHHDMTPMVRVPLASGALTLKLDGGAGLLFRRRF